MPLDLSSLGWSPATPDTAATQPHTIRPHLAQTMRSARDAGASLSADLTADRLDAVLATLAAQPVEALPLGSASSVEFPRVDGLDARIDLVLYLGGIARVFAEEDQTSVHGAADRLDTTAREVGAVRALGVLLVASAADGVLVRSPDETTWHPVSRSVLDELLAPRAILLLTRLRHRLGRAIDPILLLLARRVQGRLHGPTPFLVSAGSRATELVVVMAWLGLDAGEEVVIVADRRAVRDELVSRLHAHGLAAESSNPQTWLLDRETRGLFGAERRVSVLGLMGFHAIDADLRADTRSRPLVLLHEVDRGFRGHAGFTLRRVLPGARVVGITELEPAVIPADLLHAYGAIEDPDGIAVAHHAPPPLPVVVHRLHLSRRDDRPQSVAATILDGMSHARLDPSVGPTLLLLPHRDVARAVRPHLAEAGWEVTDATAWTQQHEGWEALREGAANVMVLRVNLPYWSELLTLRRAVVARSIGAVTWSRLQRMVGAEAPEKTHGEIWTIDAVHAEEAALAAALDRIGPVVFE